MKVHGQAMRSLWPVTHHGVRAIGIIDQTLLPYTFVTVELVTCTAVVTAIKTMQVRGAPLIGVAGAYGLALAMQEDASTAALESAYQTLAQARPTAVNLRWALDHVRNLLLPLPSEQRAGAAWQEAQRLADEDVAINQALGEHGAQLLIQRHRQLGRSKQQPLNVLTHCNAGWIATVDYGTALSAIYQAHDAGLALHVWVDETRPRNQGLLTAWELAAHGVPHTLIADNAGGHLMQHKQVDLVLVGADRVSGNGDVCNKIGTYLKAVAAYDNQVPFYAAVPSPTIDWSLRDAVNDIAIEERDPEELRVVRGVTASGEPAAVHIASTSTPIGNPAFDVTPARLVTGIITELGIAAPQQLRKLFSRP